MARSLALSGKEMAQSQLGSEKVRNPFESKNLKMKFEGENHMHAHTLHQRFDWTLESLWSFSIQSHREPSLIRSKVDRICLGLSPLYPLDFYLFNCFSISQFLKTSSGHLRVLKYSLELFISSYTYMCIYVFIFFWGFPLWNGLRQSLELPSFLLLQMPQGFPEFATDSWGSAAQKGATFLGGSATLKADKIILYF